MWHCQICSAGGRKDSIFCVSIVATGPTLTAWGYRSTHPLFLSCVQAIYPGKQAEIYRMARGAFCRMQKCVHAGSSLR